MNEKERKVEITLSELVDAALQVNQVKGVLLDDRDLEVFVGDYKGDDGSFYISPKKIRFEKSEKGIGNNRKDRWLLKDWFTVVV